MTLLRTTVQSVVHAVTPADEPGHEGDGYLAANLLTILLHCRMDLRGYDFSHLTLRQVYLCEVALPAVNFTHSHFRDTLFTDPFEVIGALTFSPDGQWLITGSYDGLVRLWRAEDGRLQQVLDGNQREIGTLAVAPDGQWLASACYDNQVLLWHLPTASRHLTLDVTMNFPHPLAFSPDSAWLALAAEERIHLLDVKSGAIVGVLAGMSGRPQVLAFCPTTALLAAGSSEGMLYLWRLDRPLTSPCQPAAKWPAHHGRLLALLFTPDGQRLVSGGADQAIHCWTLAPTLVGERQWSVAEHGDVVAALALGAAGQLLASGSPDQTIRLWAMRNGRLLATLATPEQRVRALAFSADGRTLVSIGNNQRIHLWDVGWRPVADAPSSATMVEVTTRLRQTIYGYANQVRTVAFLPNQPLLISGGTDKMVHWWQPLTGQWLRARRGHCGWIQSIAVSPDGTLIASADQAQQIYLWASNDPTGAYQILQNAPARGHFFVDLAFSPDGRFLAGGSGTGITLWRIREGGNRTAPSQRPTLTLHQTLTMARSNLVALAFHPSGAWLVGVTLTGDLYLWRTADGQLCQTLASAIAGGALPAFSADGQALLIAGMDETIQIWPLTVDNDGLARCQRSHTLCRNSGRTVALAVNPQGANLATGAYDGDVYLWDAHSGARLHRLQGHAGWITRVSYAADGQTLASAATDGTIRIWRVCDGAPLQILTVPGPYAGMDITHSHGLTDTQRASLQALGAINTNPPHLYRKNCFHKTIVKMVDKMMRR